MSEKLQCPLCGSTEIVTNVKIREFSDPFGGSEEVNVNEHHCNICGISADFLDKNDKIIQSAVDRLREKGVIEILNDFAESGHSFAFMERALELPQRTLTKWKKNGKATAAGISLLRFLRLFPWLLDVAESRYEFNEAQRININAALKKVIFHDPLAKEQPPGVYSGAGDTYVLNGPVFMSSPELKIEHSQMLL